MRRADRLFQIIQLIRRHSVTTARDLAEALEVSERTVKRDLKYGRAWLNAEMKSRSGHVPGA